MTDERLRRIFVGAPYAVLRYVGLDMWGWVIGTTLFYLTLLGGFFACCMLNCCGAARVIQARWRGTELKPEVDRDALEAIFTEFCRVYRMADMNNTIWAKLCRETKGLLDDKFTRDSGIDMVWTRCAKTNKTVGFPVFEHMLREVAALKGMDLFQLESLVVENAKVKQSGTKAQNVKFYEVPKPKTTKGDQIDLASMTNTGR